MWSFADPDAPACQRWCLCAVWISPCRPYPGFRPVGCWVLTWGSQACFRVGFEWGPRAVFSQAGACVIVVCIQLLGVPCTIEKALNADVLPNGTALRLDKKKHFSRKREKAGKVDSPLFAAQV